MSNKRKPIHNRSVGSKTESKSIEREEINKDGVGQSNDCPMETCDGDVIKDGKTEERYCNVCGLVVDDTSIDHGPEWRSFDDSSKEDKRRVGAALTNTMHDRGLSTQIASTTHDRNGEQLSIRKQNQMKRLKKWQNRCVAGDGKSRGVKKGLTEINRMVSALGIGDSVSEMAATIFRKASDQDLLIGRSVESVASAGVYAAARINGVSQSFGEIQEVSRVEKKEIKRCYMYLYRELGLTIPPAPPEEYIERFGSKLGLEKKVALESERIAKQHYNSDHSNGAAPTSLAAAAIYAATVINNIDMTQAEIAGTIDVSQPTIREFYKEMLQVYDGVDLSEIGGGEGYTSNEIKEYLNNKETNKHITA